jgi:NAD(P)-dependent dehydrogenase (short-subunit alcohol dehydrogenase family)
MATPEGRTTDGFETQFGTNHIGHFALFQCLKPVLLSSSTPSFPSRVISLSSVGHRFGSVRLHDYNFAETNSYNPWSSYGQAKTANIWFSNELERRYGGKGLHSTSVHPGGIITGLYTHVTQAEMDATFTPELLLYNKSPAQGAATSVYAALAEEWKDKGGRFLSDCMEQGPVVGNPPLGVDGDGYKPWAYDEEGEKRLWTDSLRMVGMADDEVV